MPRGSGCGRRRFILRHGRRRIRGSCDSDRGAWRCQGNRSRRLQHRRGRYGWSGALGGGGGGGRGGGWGHGRSGLAKHHRRHTRYTGSESAATNRGRVRKFIARQGRGVVHWSAHGGWGPRAARCWQRFRVCTHTPPTDKLLAAKLVARGKLHLLAALCLLAAPMCACHGLPGENTTLQLCGHCYLTALTQQARGRVAPRGGFSESFEARSGTSRNIFREGR